MAAGHSDIELVVVVHYIPGGVEFHRGAGAETAAPHPLIAVAGDSLYRAGGQVNLPQGVVFGIGHIQSFPGPGDALGMIELGRGKIAIGQALNPGADNL